MQPITPRIKKILIEKLMKYIKNYYFLGIFLAFIPLRITGRLKIILNIYNLKTVKNPLLKFFNIDLSLIESNRIFKKI
jgi:hypothetical protein